MREKIFVWTVICLFFSAARAQCPPVQITPGIPWFEDFEGYPHNAAVPLDACWATPETLVVNNGTSPFVYTGYPYACHSGDNSLELKQSPVMVVFPEFANSIDKLTISFWGNTSAQNAAAAGTLTLGVITDITNPTTFIPVDTIPATAFGRTGQDAPYTNFMGEHSFSGVTPQPGMRIALRLTNTQRSWNLDDITITASAPELNADTLPFIATFSNEEDWWLNNGDADNRWVIGIPDGSSDTALFVTHDGHSAGYNDAVSATVMAEKALVMPAADTLRLDFDVRAGGESHFDFLKVFLVPEEVEFTAGKYNNAQSQSQYADYALDFTTYKPQSAGSDGYPYLFNLSGGTVHVTAGLTNPAPGGRAKLVFLWRNDNTTGTQPSAVISHVTVVEGAPCKTPTNVTISGMTDISASVSWDADPEASSWNIRYRPVDDTLNDVLIATTTTNSYTLTELTPETPYEVQVQANCGIGNLSEWSETVTESTTVGLNSWLSGSVTLYPNPAKEYVDIRVDGDVDVKMMKVYDVYGKLIYTVNVIDNPTRINLSSLTSGMYFMRITTEAGTVTKPFVKKQTLNH